MNPFGTAWYGTAGHGHGTAKQGTAADSYGAQLYFTRLPTSGFKFEHKGSELNTQKIIKQPLNNG